MINLRSNKSFQSIFVARVFPKSRTGAAKVGLPFPNLAKIRRASSPKPACMRPDDLIDGPR